MAEPSTRVAFFSSAWSRPHDERSFVARGIAGAVSRLATIDVFVPGPLGPPRPDGAFDVVPVGGTDGSDDWPSHAAIDWGPDGRFRVAVVDGASPGAFDLARRHLPDVPVVAVASAPDRLTTDGGSPIAASPIAASPIAASLVVGLDGATGEIADPDIGHRDGAASHQIGHHVTVSALAAERRHVGIGFTGYILVLGGPAADTVHAADEDPSALAAWIVARFPRSVVVVVDDAAATVWRSRSLLGRLTVDSRMDLWRLVAHAAMTIDLAPGALLARECVESLRYGVPIVVPAGTAAHRLAAAGGGLWFDDVAQLLGCIEALSDPALASTLGRQGRDVADHWYGDPAAFVARVGAAIADVGRPSARGQRR